MESHSRARVGMVRGLVAKRIATVLCVLGVAVAMLLSQFTWFELSVPINGVPQQLQASGTESGAAILPLLLAALAAVLALLMLNGRIGRFVTAAVVSALLVIALIVIVRTMQDAAAVFVDEVNALTATSSAEAARETISQGVLTTSPMPMFTVVSVVVAWLGSCLAMVSCGSWPSGGRRYDRASGGGADESLEDGEVNGSSSATVRDRAADRHIDQWDALSNGDDPTDR